MPFLRPDTLIHSFEVLPSMRVADFGCGSGHWAVLFSKAVGSSGRVFAVDVQESALEATRSQANYAHVQNIETIRANLELSGATALKEATLDIVMISNMLFLTEEKANVIAEAHRILKPGGRVFLIEWDTADSNSLVGPPASQRVSRQAANQLCTTRGFRFEKEFNAGSYHYGLIFRK